MKYFFFFFTLGFSCLPVLFTAMWLVDFFRSLHVPIRFRGIDNDEIIYINMCIDRWLRTQITNVNTETHTQICPFLSTGIFSYIVYINFHVTLSFWSQMKYSLWYLVVFFLFPTSIGEQAHVRPAHTHISVHHIAIIAQLRKT